MNARRGRGRCVLCALALVVGAAAATANAGAAGAHAGDELDPAGGEVLCDRSVAVLGRPGAASRSPGGRLFEQPCLRPEDDPQGDGWIVFGHLEAGVLHAGGGADNAYFVEYADRSSGPVVTQLSVRAHKLSAAEYAELDAGNIGRDDAHADLRVGKAGNAAARIVWDRIPHTLSGTARPLHEASGSQYLRLPPGIAPGSISASDAGQLAALDRTIAGRGENELDVARERLGLSGNYEVVQGLNAEIDFRHENREGERAFAGSFMFDRPGTGGVLELVEPVDYRSRDLGLGLVLDTERLDLNVRHSWSWFDNGADTLDYENPWLVGSAENFVSLRGQSDLAPDNEARQFRVDGSYRLPFWNARAGFGWEEGRQQQDDALLPFTADTGTIQVFDGVIDLADWNAPAALPRSSARAQIDVHSARLELHLQPLHALRLGVGFRARDEDNHTPPFDACNALSGACAFVLFDGALASLTGDPGAFRLFDAAAGRFAGFHYRSLPVATDRRLFTFTLDHTLAMKTDLGFDYQRESTEHAIREYARTQEDRYRWSLVSRALGEGSLRLQAGYATRRHEGAYDANPYHAYWTEELLREFIADPDADPATVADARLALARQPPHTLAELRRFDVADREQRTLAAKFNAAAGELTDLVLSADVRDADYDAAAGLHEERALGLGVDLSHSPGARSSWYLGYYFETRESAMRTVTASNRGTDADFGGVQYPPENAWSSGEDQTNHFLSAGLERQLGARLRMELGYAYGITRTEIDYAAASARAFARNLPAAGMPLRGRFADLEYAQHQLRFGLRGGIDAQLSWRLLVQYERGSIEDFLDPGPRYAGDGKILLGGGVQDWSAAMMGIMVQYRF